MHRHVDVADIHRHAGVGGCPIEKGGSLRKKRKAVGQKKGVVDMHRHVDVADIHRHADVADIHRHAGVGGCPIEKGGSLRK